MDNKAGNSDQEIRDNNFKQCVTLLANQGIDGQAAGAACSAALDMANEMYAGSGGPPDGEPPAPGTAKPPKATSGDFIRKFYVAETKTLKNGDIEAYVSTESIDRVGDVIKTSGWQLDNYIRTGAPVLFAHDMNQPPIGNAVDIQAQRKGLWSVTRFHEKTQLSRELAILAREKLMPNWSVGFNPIDAPEVRKDADGNFAGYIFKKQELLEYSLVPVPANPEAVSKAIWMSKRGLITHQLAAIIAGPSPLAEEDDAVFGGKEEALRAKQAIQNHEVKLIGNLFMKRYLDGK